MAVLAIVTIIPVILLAALPQEAIGIDVLMLVYIILHMSVITDIPESLIMRMDATSIS